MSRANASDVLYEIDTQAQRLLNSGVFTRVVMPQYGGSHDRVSISGHPKRRAGLGLVVKPKAPEIDIVRVNGRQIEISTWLGSVPDLKNNKVLDLVDIDPDQSAETQAKSILEKVRLILASQRV